MGTCTGPVWPDKNRQMSIKMWRYFVKKSVELVDTRRGKTRERVVHSSNPCNDHYLDFYLSTIPNLLLKMFVRCLTSYLVPRPKIILRGWPILKNEMANAFRYYKWTSTTAMTTPYFICLAWMSPAVRPDDGIKSGQNISKSDPKRSHCSFYLKMIFSKTVQKVAKYLGFSSKKNCCLDLTIVAQSGRTGRNDLPYASYRPGAQNKAVCLERKSNQLRICSRQYETST